MSAATGIVYYRKGAGYASVPATLIASSGSDRLVVIYSWPVYTPLEPNQSVTAGSPVQIGDAAIIASSPISLSVPESASPPTQPTDPDFVYVPD